MTWDAEAVEDCAARWRELDEPCPSGIAAFVDAHERLIDLCQQAERSEPDAVIHDLQAGEVTAVWNEEKVAVVVEIGERAAAGASSRG